MNQVYKQFQLYLMLQNCTLGWARTDCKNVRTKAIGNIIDVIECFEERTSVATEAAEASNVSIPSDDDPVDRAAVTDEIAKISMQKDKVQFLVEICKFTSLTDPKAIKKLALHSTANFWTSKGSQSL